MKINAVALFALGIGALAVTAPIAIAGHGAHVQAAQSLDNASLKTVLEGMGYEPKALSKGYLIAIKRDDWTYNMQLVLSSDSSKLGINANLGKVDKPEEVAADSWFKLLVANGDIDPSFFYFDKSQGKLYMHRVLDNREITAAFLREQIDGFCGNIKSTADAWKFTK
ncbi:MAG TPA: hypothetical protein VKT78_06420 [Fimbriimonadaceae bacterium]|nr:hypothetical protein [Fimbriimonadaceae bacterium]